MLHSTQDLRTSVQGMVSQVMYQKGFNLDSKLSKDEQVEILKTISNITKDNDIIKLPEFDYKAFEQSFQQFMIFISNKITMNHFNQYSFNADIVNKEIAKSLSLVTGTIRTEEQSNLEENLNIINTFFNSIGPKAMELTEEMNKCKDYHEGCALLIDRMFEDNYKYYKVFNKNKLIDVYSNICSKSKELTEEDTFKMMLSDSSIVKDNFKELFEKIAKKAKEDFDKQEKASQDDNKDSDKDSKSDKTEESKSVRELLDTDYSEAVKLFHGMLNKNGIGCNFKVAKIILRDFKELSMFPEDVAYNMILTLVQTRGISYYEKIAAEEQAKAKEEKAKKEQEKASQDDNKDSDKDSKSDKTEESKSEVEAEIVSEDVNFPLVEEDLTKDDRQEVSGKPSLKYEEPKFNFKEGNKEAIKKFLNVSTKTDTKANVRKYLAEKINKWEQAFNYENAQDVPVYMIKNVKHLKDEFAFIESTEDAGLNNNSITTFIASEFKEALKGMNKATLKELQEFAELCDTVDAMILDEYKAK